MTTEELRKAAERCRRELVDSWADVPVKGPTYTELLAVLDAYIAEHPVTHVRRTRRSNEGENMSFKHGGPDQMTVGEILGRLKRMNPDSPSRWTFGPPHSYRGYYDQVAVTVHAYESSVGDAVAEITKCLDTFTGYKGGEFTMDLSTPVWVASAGDTGFPLTQRFLDLFLG
jgi:hypothetical protein